MELSRRNSPPGRPGSFLPRISPLRFPHCSRLPRRSECLAKNNQANLFVSSPNFTRFRQATRATPRSLLTRDRTARLKNMTRQVIQKAMTQKPFRRFSVRLTDGELVKIRGEHTA